MKAIFPLESTGNLVVLTGAGVSAASGIQTYRGVQGAYKNPDVLRLAKRSTWEEDPRSVVEFFAERRAIASEVQPNGAHHFLAELEKTAPGDFLLVTQNIDGLYQRAGSRNVVEYHGSLFGTRCRTRDCGWTGEADWGTPCPQCSGLLGPSVVLFGEMIPPEASRKVQQTLERCTLFISVGTSGLVWPASAMAATAKASGAKTICINPDPVACQGFDLALVMEGEEGLRKLFGDQGA